MQPGLGSNGCSPLTPLAPKCAAPIPIQPLPSRAPKSHNHCAEELGRVDGFDEDEPKSQGDEGAVALGRLLTPERHTFEALELANGLLNASASAVERFREERGRAFGVRLVGNSRGDAALPSDGTIGLGVIAFVGQSHPRCDVRSEIEQGREPRTVAGLATRQTEGEWSPFEVALEVDFRREAASRAAERLARLPPFAPAAETWARTIVESNIWTR